MKTSRIISLVLFVLVGLAGLSSANLLHPDLIECKPGSPAMFKFLGKNAVNLVEGQVATFETFCFKENTASLKWKSATEVEIIIDSRKKRSFFCSDEVVITSFLDSKFKTQFFPGKNTIKMQLHHAADQDYVKKIGISIVPLCDKLRNIIPDLISTGLIFADSLSSILPKWLVRKILDDNYRKLERLTGQKSVERKVKHAITYEWLAQNVKSGDVYCEFTESGGNMVILFGTGGVCDHVGMFLWEGPTLYFVEMSQPHVRRMDAKTYLDHKAKEQTDNLSLLPLRDDLRAKFDVDKAWKVFYEFQDKKIDYGFENIIYSFWDTPHDSFTTLANVELIMTYVAIGQTIPAARPLISKYLEEALNNRLGTNGLEFSAIIEEIAQRGISINELGAMPELETYMYGPDKTPRYICSALVVKIFMEAGVLSDYKISPQEFTPNDVYNLKLWKTDGLPAECAANDPYLPYCQLTGHRALLPFKWFNAIEPYDHMNERCPALAPVYDRPAGC